jgi:hypothetical protein
MKAHGNLKFNKGIWEKKKKKYIKTVSQVDKLNKIKNSFIRVQVINSRKVLKQRKKENNGWSKSFRTKL